MLNTIEITLRSHGLNYQIVQNMAHQQVLKMGFNLDNGRVDIFIDIRPDEEQVIISSILPTNIPPNHRNRIAEYITRANQGLILGNFDMDYDDGEVKYKTSYCYDVGIGTSPVVFMKNLMANIHMMDRYMPGFMTVVYANSLPSVAINQIEGNSSHQLN